MLFASHVHYASVFLPLVLLHFTSVSYGNVLFPFNSTSNYASSLTYASSVPSSGLPPDKTATVANSTTATSCKPNLATITPDPRWGHQIIPYNNCTTVGSNCVISWVSSCRMSFGTLDMTYFPTTTMKGYAYPSRYIRNDLNLTMYSPSVYLVFNTVSASNDCGQVGPTLKNAVVSMDITEARTLLPFANPTAKTRIGWPFSYYAPLDLADFEGCPKTWNSTPSYQERAHPTPGLWNRCNPTVYQEIEFKHDLAAAYWAGSCGRGGGVDGWGILDPPTGIPPCLEDDVECLLGTTKAVEVPLPTSPPAVTVPVPQPDQPVSTPAPVVSNDAPPASIPALPDNTPAASDIPVPSVPPVVTDVPVPTIPPAVTDIPVPTIPPAVTDIPVPTIPPVVTDIPAPDNTPAPSVPQIGTELPAASDIPIPSIPPLGTDIPAASNIPAPDNTLAAGVTPMPNNSPAPSDIPIPSGAPNPPGTAVNFPTEPSVAISGAIPPLQTVPAGITAAPAPPDVPIATLGGGNIISAGPGATSIEVAGQTAYLGGPPITIPGEGIVQLTPTGVVVGNLVDGSSATYALPTGPVPAAVAVPIATLGGSNIISAAPGATSIEVAGQTAYLGGPPITIPGEGVVQLTPTGVVIGNLADGSSATYALPTGPVPVAAAVPIATLGGNNIISAAPGATSIEVAGQTAYLGGPPITIAGGVVQLTPTGVVVGNPVDGSSATYALPTGPVPAAVAIATVGGQIISAAPGASTVVIGSQTLTAGGAVITFSGNSGQAEAVASLGPSGIVIQYASGGASTYALPSAKSGASPMAVALPSISVINPSAIVLGGTQTLSIGGAAITLPGNQVVSLGPGGLVDQLSGCSLTTIALPVASGTGIGAASGLGEGRVGNGGGAAVVAAAVTGSTNTTATGKYAGSMAPIPSTFLQSSEAGAIATPYAWGCRALGLIVMIFMV